MSPPTALGAEPTRRDHAVAQAGHPGTLAPLLPAGARIPPATPPAKEDP
ncbi:hypothetical protein [Actinomadura sp. DC4]|nr:hypothetical protein [Actinomadura sp. DC4]MDN3356370.1 hypothetical protein [Actinomadura sp. DC4]